MPAEFVNTLLSSTSLTQNPHPIPTLQGPVNPSPQESRESYPSVHVQQQPRDMVLVAPQASPHQLPQLVRPAEVSTASATPLERAGTNSTDAQSMTSASTSANTSLSSQPESFRHRIAHLMTDERRFHAPSAVLERVHQFFKGPPQLDAAAFEGSTLNALISIPFPDIMDTDGWRVPASFNTGGLSNTAVEYVPVQSCFLHVPILPSKRRYETETEVVMLDDVRLAGQLNAKLWEEFSTGNVAEAISLVPTSATWFGKTELADWPCVIMSGLKFEQANGSDPSGKKFSEVHSYIAVYLGRDPVRQVQFVQTFQDLGISSLQHVEGSFGATSPTVAASNSHQPQNQHHRWIAGFRRLFRTQGSAPNGIGPVGAMQADREDDAESIDPQFDDIYSILPPNKKPRLERVGRPSDAQASWHHSKRRKTDKREFSKLKDHNQDNRKLGMDDYTSGSDSDYAKYWIDWFLGTKGNEYFCEVDEEYILDRFNLTGLNTEVQFYSQALDMITDNLDENLDEEMRDAVDKSARHLYGLIHARFIITTHGLTKMLEKFKKCDFGRCPRVLCHNHPLLPVALSDAPYTKSVKLFCCRCEDIYNPKSTRHASIDGAYFGCSFPHMLFQVYPQLVPPKTLDRYVPRIFGFKLHDVAKQHRYQDMIRQESHARIMAGIEGLPTTAAQGSSKDGQPNNHNKKATEGNSSVTESGAMADVNN
ncbi:casein kinase 2 regulatory subunit [Mortierella sp. NVP85]|nr:casein kinase 2 regulatory subunit [Mortierella sp. NVP85]